MITYKLTMIDGITFELLSDDGKDREYDVTFVDRKGKVKGMFTDQHVTIYETKLKPNMWAKCSRKYLSDVAIFVKYEGRVVKQINLLDELKGKKVFITFESSSLGDTLAWMPYCLTLKNTYGCDVVVSTFKNFLFEAVYPELTFVPRGVTVHNIVGMFKLGWYWDDTFEPTHPATIPLQQTATNILHLPFEEIIPRLAIAPGKRPVVNEYVCISTKSTAECKHWPYWFKLVAWLKSKGYRVFEMSNNADDYGTEKLSDTSLENVITYLEHADMYIGLSSGISWLNWALGKTTVMIANFTLPDHEFQKNCIRITKPSVCNGCWNNPNFKFDRGDWQWCPIWKNSPRQFECQKAISLQDVITSLPISSAHEF